MLSTASPQTSRASAATLAKKIPFSIRPLKTRAPQYRSAPCAGKREFFCKQRKSTTRWRRGGGGGGDDDGDDGDNERQWCESSSCAPFVVLIRRLAAARTLARVVVATSARPLARPLTRLGESVRGRALLTCARCVQIAAIAATTVAAAIAVACCRLLPALAEARAERPSHFAVSGPMDSMNNIESDMISNVLIVLSYLLCILTFPISICFSFQVSKRAAGELRGARASAKKKKRSLPPSFALAGCKRISTRRCFSNWPPDAWRRSWAR